MLLLNAVVDLEGAQQAHPLFFSSHSVSECLEIRLNLTQESIKNFESFQGP